MAHDADEAHSLIRIHLLRTCLVAVDPPRKKHSEARVETHSVGRSETFLNGPDGSTFGVSCNHSFT